MQILKTGRRTDLVVFTVGTLAREALVFNLGHLHEGEVTRLLEHSAGDACSRFFTTSGEVAVPEINARTAGIFLVDLASRPIRVLVARGSEEAVALKAVARMSLAIRVAVDQGLVLALLLEDEAGD